MTTNRTAYTQGLRALADALDHDPELPLPYSGTHHDIAVFTDRPEDLHAYRALLSEVERKITDQGIYDFQMHGSLHGLRIRVYAPLALAMPAEPVTT